MAWEKKVWVDNQTPLCAENMNHLEDGIDSKVDKSTSKKVLYGTNDEGTAQVVLPYSLLPGESNIAQFDTGGHLYTKLPSIGDHCANKEYVDNCVQNMPTDINVDSDHKLILEHNGTEIPGQKKQVVVPPFTKEGTTFILDDNLELRNVKINEYGLIDFDGKAIFILQDSDFIIRMPHTSGSITYTDYVFSLRDDIGGDVAVKSDITSALKNNFGTNTDIDNMF